HPHVFPLDAAADSSGIVLSSFRLRRHSSRLMQTPGRRRPYGERPVINAGFPLDRNLLPMAISAAGAALAWLTGEVTGLLIVAAAISIFGGRQASLLSTTAFGLALVVLFLVVGWDAAAERELAVGLAVGLCISALVHFDQVSSSSDRDEKEARLIVES